MCLELVIDRRKFSFQKTETSVLSSTWRGGVRKPSGPQQNGARQGEGGGNSALLARGAVHSK